MEWEPDTSNEDGTAEKRYTSTCTLHRNNNFVESWTCTCPTISHFIAAVRMEQSSTDGKITTFMVGEMPPKKNKAHSDIDNKKNSDIDNKKNSDITTAIATPPDACGKRYNYREAMQRCERERSEPCLETSCKFIAGTIKEVKI